MADSEGIEVRELTRDEVRAAARVLPFARLDSMQTYLVAWRGTEPLGHAHIAWEATKLGFPEVQDVFVLAGYRRTGIATELTRSAERLAAERGHAKISLSYSIANRPARILYKHLGYANAGLPPERVKGVIVLRGEPHEVDDTLVYLVKDLAPQPF